MTAQEHTLADRARRLLRASGGCTDEAQLLAGLFGATGDAERWAGLVRHVLDPLPDVRRTAEGRWELSSLASSISVRPSEATFVAMATAATSANPSRARLVSFAAVRVCRTQPVGVFGATLNPACRVPRYLIEATGLSQAELEEAPTFEDLLQPLVEFLGEDPLAGVEMPAQLELLGRELSRLDRPGLSNPVLDLGGLARRLGVAHGKPGLPSLAAATGLTHPRPYHPPTDARVAARLAVKLLAESEARGLSAADVFTSAWQCPSPGALLGPTPPLGLDGPGVYLLKDQAGQVLYVGKARHVQRRLAAYHRRQLSILRRMEGLAAAVHHVESVATSSELEAIILEARLVRQHQPLYNTQRQPRLPALYLRADLVEGRATLTACHDLQADGAHYLGPFRTARGAAAALRLTRQLFPGLKGRARKAALERRPLLQQALRFLAGQKREVLDRLRAEQRAMAARGDQLAVTASRQLLRRVVGFDLDTAALCVRPLDERLLVLSPTRDGRMLAHLIERGRLVACFAVDDEAEARARGASWPRRYGQCTESVDEPNLVFRWLCGLGREHRVIRLDAGA
jgi:DNA polymerase III epsilon subunit-like protein